MSTFNDIKERKTYFLRKLKTYHRREQSSFEWLMNFHKDHPDETKKIVKNNMDKMYWEER